MPSINVDLDFLEHPKFIHVQSKLGDKALEILMRIWIHVAKYSPAAGTIEDGAFLARVINVQESKVADIVNALTSPPAGFQYGFLEKRDDGILAVHDWKDHGGHIIAYRDRARIARAARYEKLKTVNRSPADDEKMAHQRPKAKTPAELLGSEFILRLDDKEFLVFVKSVEAMIADENRPRRSNPFFWQPATGSFERDLRSLIYKIKDDEKIEILRELLNVLGQKYNWPEAVRLAVKATVRASLRSHIENCYAFTLYKLKHPHELIADATDGALAKPLTELLNTRRG